MIVSWLKQIKIMVFSQTTIKDKPQNSYLTKYFEGGRNTPRGTYNINSSVYHLNKKQDY